MASTPPKGSNPAEPGRDLIKTLNELNAMQQAEEKKMSDLTALLDEGDDREFSKVLSGVNQLEELLDLKMPDELILENGEPFKFKFNGLKRIYNQGIAIKRSLNIRWLVENNFIQFNHRPITHKYKYVKTSNIHFFAFIGE